MVKCPLCSFDNEDGALFCEQCKSDLSSVPVAEAMPVEAIPMAAVEEAVPMAAVFEDVEKTAPLPVAEAFAVADEVPMAAVAEAMPVEAYEAIPMAQAEPVIPVAVAEASTEPIPVLSLDAFPVATPAMPVAEVLPSIPLPPPAPPPAAPAAAAPIPAFVPAAAPAPAPAAPAAPSAGIPAGATPRLKVMRGLKVGVEFPIYGDYNYIGRADDKPVDIDLEDQEPPDRVWCSRQHAVIHFDEAAGAITLEDLNSSNGTYVNRTRVYPGEKKVLNPNDVVQIGTVHMKLLV